MATSPSKKALRQYRRDNGLCIHCGNTTLPDRKMCQTCTTKDRETAKRCAERKAARGICPEHGCSNKPAPGNKYCDTCNKHNSAHTAARRNARVATGLCAHCGVQPRWNGKTRCEACHQTMLDRCGTLHKQRTARGCCGRCGLNSVVPGHKRCVQCLDSGSRRHAARKLEILYAYGGPVCVGCGETTVCVLQMDHIHGGGHAQALELGNGIASRGRAKMYKWLIDNNFPPGFRVLCSNCNIRAARGIPFPNESSSQS